MKYGLRYHEGQGKPDEKDKKRILNIGDMMMCLSIKKLYERMGIPEEEIVLIQTYERADYRGEYLVLPYNFYESNLSVSERILPVFLSWAAEWEQDWSEQDIATLRRYSPIGCRDELTMRELHKRGIDAYLNGCMVATFPKRTICPETQTKVFIVDVHKDVLDIIPQNILNEACFFTHEYFESMSDFLGEYDTIFDKAQATIDMYAKEASLIITSRFHAAVIALALGIPCILYMENFYAKYTWLERKMHVYTKNDIDRIEWNPLPICISDEEKELMLSIAEKRIRETYEKYHDMCELSEKREDINRRDLGYLFYGDEAIEYINNNWNHEDRIEYSFWGVTHTATRIHRFICDNYSNAVLVNVYDMAVENTFLGKVPKRPECLKDDKPTFVFVSADSAYNAAKRLFADMNKPSNEFFYCRRKNDNK